MVWFVMALPLLAALLCPLLSRRGEKTLSWWAVFATGITLLCMLLTVWNGYGRTFTLPVCHLTVSLDGFRCLYGVVVCFMWFVSALLSPQYFHHYRNMGRYWFFFLLCLATTLGVFLSYDLYTTFLFFELMSLSSYVWVVQEETEGAMDAGRTYLTIAVIGGLVLLMGLFLLYDLVGTLSIPALRDACAAVTDRGRLWAAALCMFFGFAAKAGLFPLHIWLPKAHPVAPAPASALLSGVLTKAGVFGVITITAEILAGETMWGALLMALGIITTVLGAGMAVFSNNLKYILACSSLSQIGFITLGVAALCLLGAENALAAHGTVLYMLNHSLVKLVLFLFAGVVYANTHALELNDIRGFGRGKPLMHAVFLCGACSLAGIPGFLGYVSKTLVHEAIVEYAHMSHLWQVTAVEWLFLFSGGLTAAYMTKVYVALFWQRSNRPYAPWGSTVTKMALCLAALPLPLLGLLPHRLAEPLARRTLDFTGGHELHHAVHYLAWINLKGVVISLTIGAAVYLLVVRRCLMGRDGSYLRRIPSWLELERLVYRPLLRGVGAVLSVLCRAVCDLPDILVMLLRRTILRDSAEKTAKSAYPLVVRLHCRLTGGKPEETADAMTTRRDIYDRFTGSLSFSLVMACLGLCATLLVVLFTVF